MSGGQQQRVAIARALANDPHVILADEPTGNLDTKTGANVMDFLTRLNLKDGKTVVMVTHDEHVADHASRIEFLKDGVVIRTEIPKPERRWHAMKHIGFGSPEELKEKKTTGSVPSRGQRHL
jgi:putative ABC transport system ATP-binding protein